MVTLQNLKDSVRATLTCGAVDADQLGQVRRLCLELLADVPLADRKAVLHRLDRLRRADDVYHLRGTLFDAIARSHGEAVALERLGQLDRHLG